MRRIAILMTEKATAQEAIVNGFRIIEDLIDSECSIKEFVSNSIDVQAINAMAQNLTNEHFDLAVSVGAQCSISLLQVTRKMRSPLPMVFVGVHEPVKLGLVSSLSKPLGNMSGVLMKNPSNLFPIQILSKIAPFPKRFLIAYRVNTQGGRIDYVVRTMTEYIKSLGTEAIPIAIDGISKMGDIIREGDAIVIPNGSLLPRDVPLLEQICADHKARMFATSGKAMARNAIFGYKADIRYIGVRAAEMAADHFLNGTPLGEMPVSVLKDTTKLVFNDDRMAELGVTPPSEDLLCSFDDSLEYYDLPRHMYTVMLPWHSQLERQTALALKNCGWPPRDGMEMIPRLVDGLPYNKSFDENQRRYVLKENNTPAIVTFGRQHFYNMQATMIAEQNFKPLIGVFFENDTATIEEPSLSHTGWPESAPIIRYPLPRFNPSAVLPFIKGLLPNLRRLGVLYNAEPGNLPPLLEQYLREIQAACDRLGLELTHDGAWDVDELNNKAFGMVPKIDALLTLPDFMRDDTAELLGPLCLRYNVFACSGNLQQTDTFSMVYGVRTSELAEDIDWLIRRIVLQKRLPRGDREFTSKRTFGIEVSVELSKRVGAQFTSEQALMLSWGISIAAATEKAPKEQDAFLNDLMARLPVRSTPDPDEHDIHL